MAKTIKEAKGFLKDKIKILLHNLKGRMFQQYYFGACFCGSEGSYFNIGRNHWFFCDKCKTKWWVGSNLFSGWRDETEEDWKRNYEKYKDYTEINAAYDSLDRFFKKIIWAVKKIKNGKMGRL